MNRKPAKKYAYPTSFFSPGFILSTSSFVYASSLLVSCLLCSSHLSLATAWFVMLFKIAPSSGDIYTFTQYWSSGIVSARKLQAKGGIDWHKARVIGDCWARSSSFTRHKLCWWWSSLKKILEVLHQKLLKCRVIEIERWCSCYTSFVAEDVVRILRVNH